MVGMPVGRANGRRGHLRLSEYLGKRDLRAEHAPLAGDGSTASITWRSASAVATTLCG